MILCWLWLLVMILERIDSSISGSVVVIWIIVIISGLVWVLVII